MGVTIFEKGREQGGKLQIYHPPQSKTKNRASANTFLTGAIMVRERSETMYAVCALIMYILAMAGNGT